GLAPLSPEDEFGPEVAGLRAKVTLRRQKFTALEPIEPDYVIKNVSPVEQVIWHSSFFLNHLVLVRDASGKEPPLTAAGERPLAMLPPGGPRSRNVPETLKPGEASVASGRVDLTALYDFTPGRYTVQYVYEERLGGWEGRLPSNEAAFEVLARKEDRVEGLAEAKAVRVEGLEFLALARQRVATPPDGGDRDFFGLQVTNVSDRPLALATFDVLRPRLYRVDGETVTELQMTSRRKDTPRPTPPALLRPGPSWSWRPEAR